MTTTVKAKFRPSTVKDRPGTIVYLVTHRRIARQITTSYKVFPREWDEKCSEPIAAGNDRRAAIVQSITRKLRSDMERLSAIIERFENLSRNYSSDDVVEKFRRTGKENTLFVFMEGVIERLRQLNHSGTAKNYSAALGSFKRFRNNEDIQMEAIDTYSWRIIRHIWLRWESYPIPFPFICVFSAQSITVPWSKN